MLRSKDEMIMKLEEAIADLRRQHSLSLEGNARDVSTLHETLRSTKQLTELQGSDLTRLAKTKRDQNARIDEMSKENKCLRSDVKKLR